MLPEAKGGRMRQERVRRGTRWGGGSGDEEREVKVSG